jgi:hypothetical protein
MSDYGKHNTSHGQSRRRLLDANEVLPGLRRKRLFWIELFICQALRIPLCPSANSLEFMVCSQILRETHSLTYGANFVVLHGLR